MNKRPLIIALGLSFLIIIFLFVGLVIVNIKNSEDPFIFGDKIGIIEIKGQITDSTKTVEEFDEFRRNKIIRAIVFRINSPGGAIGPTQEIYQEIKRTILTKPVICSMGGIAASGGFYVASACTKIVANPGTITGSIGVISIFPNIQNLLNKIGIKIETIKSGNLKATAMPYRTMTSREKNMIQNMSYDLHNQFINHIASSRNLPKKNIQAIADGGVFSGQKALELGLVDELGNFRDAIRLATRLGNIKSIPTLIYSSNKHDFCWSRLFTNKIFNLFNEFIEILGYNTNFQYVTSLNN